VAGPGRGGGRAAVTNRVEANLPLQRSILTALQLINLETEAAGMIDPALVVTLALAACQTQFEPLVETGARGANRSKLSRSGPPP
jgi:hypothetical protein